MHSVAPRDLWRLLGGSARGARLAACLWLAVLAGGARAGVIVEAAYAEPTTRYDHGILGDAVEWGALVLTVDICADCASRDLRRVTIRLPKTRVFEDTAPRLIADEGGGVLAMVVETDLDQGARLAIYDEGGLVTATPFIGRTHRWLAPVGAGDLDGDGRIEVAYVDRPHLAKTLRVWRLQDGRLEHVADLGGLTNHRIGWDFIPGGIRNCDGVSEMIVADAALTRVMAVRLRDGALKARPLAAYRTPKSLDAALNCR